MHSGLCEMDAFSSQAREALYSGRWKRVYPGGGSSPGLRAITEPAGRACSSDPFPSIKSLSAGESFAEVTDSRSATPSPYHKAIQFPTADNARS